MEFKRQYTKEESAIELVKIDARINAKKNELRLLGEDCLHIRSMIADLLNWKNHYLENTVFA